MCDENNEKRQEEVRAGAEGADNPDQRERRVPPRIYVASLSDYNAGRLHGAWVDADQDAEELQLAVATMLAASPEPGAEEWAIHDHEGFGPVDLSEYESLETIASLGRGIAEHGLAFGAWAAIVGAELAALEQFEEAYRGRWESVTDYAESLLDELGATDVLDQVPEWLQPYVELDVGGFARDLVLGGDIRTVEGESGVWVFDGHL